MTPQQSSPSPRTALGRTRCADPCAIVIFGASGDLAQRKLIPALYNLLLDDLLPDDFAVVGVGRKPVDRDEFIAAFRTGVERYSRQDLDDERFASLADRISYAVADRDYGGLAEHLAEVDRSHGTRGNRLYYLATPPSAFPKIVGSLKDAGLHRPGADGEWARIVLEKPIGHDLESARGLNDCVNAAFDEGDVFRIDHYLGKETVQNLLVYRFANAIWEPLWNQKYVDNVQITVAESIGVEGRGDYFEAAGMTRDMVQNHMFQLVCLTAMEPPVSLAPDAIRTEKVKVLQALRPVTPEQVDSMSVRGQYASGVTDGEGVPGYREEEGVAADSRTETFVALRLYIDNWRWAGVPFYLRAGKRLPKRCTEIALQFRDVPHRLFTNDPPAPNKLILRVQPDEGITLRFDAKVPGTEPRIESVDSDFSYSSSFGAEPPEAYERLLLDAMLGDSTLFIRRDEVESSWAFIDRLQEGWARHQHPLPEYTAGTWGPAEAEVLIARDGRTWRRP